MNGLWKAAEIVLFQQGGIVLLLGAVAAMAYRDRIVAWIEGRSDDRADVASIEGYKRRRKAIGDGC